ncbi:MAG TPA: energy transducer TonB [Candidatus Eisenbacteria bacterium]|nr:energy transducer TonB [Candidatus Eisenbacteria bacterium]
MPERNAHAVLDEVEHPIQQPLTRPVIPPRDTPKQPAPKPLADLSAGMLDFNRMTRPKKAIDVVFSAVIHIGFLAFLLLIPLLFTNALDFAKMNTTYLVAPPPPPPPPPPALKVIHEPRKMPTFIKHGELIAPRIIPKKIEVIKDLRSASEVVPGVAGGVPGGVPGGQSGGVLGGIIGGTGRMAPPPPKPPAEARGPYRVGGNIQAPVLIHRSQPIYPPLARMARVQGDVVIECVIDKQGDVTQMHVVSGHPLLVQAAMQAVSEWKYSPTLLNGSPVSVEMEVTVQFRMPQ